MLSEELGIEDKTIIEKLERINMLKISADDAQRFGVQIGFYKDAYDAYMRLKQNARENLYVLLSTMTLLLIGNALSFGMGSMLIGIVSLSSLKLLYDTMRERAAAFSSKTQLKILEDDVSELATRYPKEDEIETLEQRLNTLGSGPSGEFDKP